MEVRIGLDRSYVGRLPRTRGDGRTVRDRSHASRSSPRTHWDVREVLASATAPLHEPPKTHALDDARVDPWRARRSANRRSLVWKILIGIT